ncbi:MAG: aminomethyl-transferring glycine dehydrogenase subunit GcvPA [Myxococcota bacterium]
MNYVPHTPDDLERMLERVGLRTIEELFASVSESLRRRAELKLAPALDEPALLEHFGERAGRNLGADRAASFLGAGAYHHFIPAVVDALASRGEFTTAYTPYQAEISQGTLQTVFEFQTLICQLTGLEVANASLYDGASAAAEAALMALRITRRRRLYLSAGLHPSYAQVIQTYTGGLGVEIESLPLGTDGRTSVASLGGEPAALLVGCPSFYGCIEDLAQLARAAREVGALCISVTSEPLALGLLQPPGALGVDIACGEAQSFGVPLSFGGPYLGFLATRHAHVRQLPGRLVGQTVDSDGQRAFVMTLTTREQHIRRERATSNICTNQGLCMLRATIHLALLGRRGLRDLARLNLSLARYARDRLTQAGLRQPYSAPVFNEFVVEVPGLAERFPAAIERGLLPGLPLGRLVPEHEGQLLVCTTELNSREQIDRLVRELSA